MYCAAVAQHIARSRCPAPMYARAVRAHADSVVASTPVPLTVASREDEVVGDDPDADANDEVKLVAAVVVVLEVVDDLVQASW